MQLSKDALGQLAANERLEIPESRLFELPEKVLQFGTGVLLRGLPDYFIDKANKQGMFNGRVVIVKTTDSDSSAFDEQDGLYTICVRGVENEKRIEENIINAAISRVLWAKADWKRILECAHNPEMKIIISNTTEVGIQLVQDDITSDPPLSFPGKLLAFLYERFKAFNGSVASGMVIIPTELITENGAKLESIVLELAHRNNLDFKFIEWLESSNTFCNSLVDRIVPGRPNENTLQQIESSLGYEDELLIIAEAFRLWAIQGDEKIKEVLSFRNADDGMVITDDITIFKELKLRLLNGTHSFNACTAFLAGFNLTREAMEDKDYLAMTKKMMYTEIAPAIPYKIETAVKENFAGKVLERFSNPFIDHQWLSITVQQTAKMGMRTIPLLLQHYTNNHEPPRHMTICFAAYLLFMRSEKDPSGKYWGNREGVKYEIKDDSAEIFYQAWKKYTPDELVTVILRMEALWETDLTRLPGFETAIRDSLHEIMEMGVSETIRKMDIKKITA